MKVGELMQTKVFTVSADDLVDRVFFLINFEKIRHLPVLDGGHLVGIVSDRDLYKALGPRGRRRSAVEQKDETALFVIPRKVRHIMRRGVITIEPEADLAKAANTMAKRKIGALPVTKGKSLIGIITATDVLRAYAQLAEELEVLKSRLAGIATDAGSKATGAQE